jgi:hypothetical protein
MFIEQLKVLQPSLSFVNTFSWKKAHNMLALMFDPRFKGLQIVTKYLNSSNMALEMVDEYY